MRFTLPDADRIRIQHMLDAAAEAQSFASGYNNVQDLSQNRMLMLSLVKCVEIIGEAAARVSPQTQNSTDGIPWRAIIAMRNRLIHGYYDVDAERVWNTVFIDLPPLVEELESLIRRASE